MNTTTLHDGQSYTVARGDFLRIDGWLTQGTAADILLDVTGDVTYTRAHDAQIYLTAFSGKANIVVRRKGGGEFPPDHSITISVSQLGTHRPERVEFPQARLDGAAERVLGELVQHRDNQVMVTAFGSTVANDLSRAAMTAVSAQRLVGLSQARSKQLLIWADASASMYHSTTDELLDSVEEMLIGVADYFDMDLHPHSHSVRAFATTHRDASTIIGAQIQPAEPGTALAVVTVTPRPVLATLGENCVVIVVGAHAHAEIAEYQRSYQEQFPLHLVAFADEQARALLSGDHQALREAAHTCARAFAVLATDSPRVTTPYSEHPTPEPGSGAFQPSPGQVHYAELNPFRTSESEHPPLAPNCEPEFTPPKSQCAPTPLFDDPNGGQH